MSENPTGFFPRSNPEGQGEQETSFNDKLFLKHTSRSILHIAINMLSISPNTFSTIGKANSKYANQFIFLTYDLTTWAGD